jgi:hypothetical protein
MRRIRVTKERLYAKEKKKGRVLGIRKEVVRQLKSMQKQKGNTQNIGNSPQL